MPYGVPAGGYVGPGVEAAVGAIGGVGSAGLGAGPGVPVPCGGTTLGKVVGAAFGVGTGCGGEAALACSWFGDVVAGAPESVEGAL